MVVILILLSMPLQESKIFGLWLFWQMQLRKATRVRDCFEISAKKWIPSNFLITVIFVCLSSNKLGMHKGKCTTIFNH